MNKAPSDEEVGCFPVPSCLDTIEDRLLRIADRYRISESSWLPIESEVVPPSVKHGLQHDGIIKRLRVLDVVAPGIAIVEMGAGKADLSDAIVSQFGFEPYDDIRVAAVDMSSFRHPADCRLRRASSFARVTIDIRDLDLPKISVLDGCDSFICVSKHLCGVGFDFALRCIVNAGKFVRAVAMAPCCHHRCSWPELVGRSFLLEHGFGIGDFPSLMRLSSRATLMSAEPAQMLLGRTCKFLINSCRVKYLREHGFASATLVDYITRRITPENVLVEARRDQGAIG